MVSVNKCRECGGPLNILHPNKNLGFCDICVCNWGGKIPFKCPVCKKIEFEFPNLVRPMIERGVLMCDHCAGKQATRKYIKQSSVGGKWIPR